MSQAIHTNYLKLNVAFQPSRDGCMGIPQEHKKCLLAALGLNTLFEVNYCHNH